MDNIKLTHTAFDHGPVQKQFAHLEHVAGLSEGGRTRVNEALKAAVAHAEEKHGLQYGIQSHHVGTALKFLEKDYEGRHDLTPKEKGFIEQSLKGHFGIKEQSPEPKTEEKVIPLPKTAPKLPGSLPEAANDENFRKAT